MLKTIFGDLFIFLVRFANFKLKRNHATNRRPPYLCAPHSTLCILQFTLHPLHWTILKGKPPNETGAVSAKLPHSTLHTSYAT